MLKFVKYIFIPILLLFVLISGFLYKSIFGEYVEKESTLTVPTNTNYKQLVELIQYKGLVKNDFIFEMISNKMNLPNNVHAGKYHFDKGASLYNLIGKLRGGLQNPVKLTINNVNFKQDLAGKIGSQLELDSVDVYSFLINDSLINLMGYNQNNVLCMFIPNTYEIYWNISLSSFLEKMNNEKQNFWNKERLTKCTNLGLSPNEVFVLASIVEKEYKFAEERARIAGVYLNRMNKNMKLQADPTVKFALGDLSLKRILNVHLEYPSEYNTYHSFGLPPGPICLPETSTIDAVLNAENHNYIYFCAKEDLSGYHVFNANYNGHLKAAKLYQQALNKLHIYE